METQTGERHARSIGRTATIAAGAGLAGLAATLALTASVLIGAVYGATDSSPAPGHEADQPDDGVRAAANARALGRLDDYGIRCQVVGWCAMPPGVPQPIVSTVTSAGSGSAGADAGAAGRLDDYGIRCLEVGWCAMPPGQPQPSRPPATE